MTDRFGDDGDGRVERDLEARQDAPDLLDAFEDTVADDLAVDDPGDADEISRAELRRRTREVVEEGRPQEGVEVFRPVERAVLVGVHLASRTAEQVEASLDELEALAETAGAQVVGRVVQRRDTPDPATYIGKGKVADLRVLLDQRRADAVIFDDELTPAQQRSLEEGVRQKVLDRTIVILDIFAQHATSREGKTQVELAQLDYLLPRLRGWGEALSRQEGRMGTRGPGESQLEVDRRRIYRRMRKLRADLVSFERVRRTKTKERDRSGQPTVALVGYTNAGKSSLLNRLTGADALVRDRLFATLDTTARRLRLPDGREVVVTDTVGFVRKLPHGLVEAFKSTLEESARADLLLHVVDASHPEAAGQIDAVREVLAEIGADQVPEQVVLNKIDAAEPGELGQLSRMVSREGGDPVAVSARTGAGIDSLLERITLRLPDRRYHVDVVIPYDRTQLVALAHSKGEVHSQEHTEQGTQLVATVDVSVARAMRDLLDPDPFAVEPDPWDGEASDAAVEDDGLAGGPDGQPLTGREEQAYAGDGRARADGDGLADDGHVDHGHLGPDDGQNRGDGRRATPRSTMT